MSRREFPVDASSISRIWRQLLISHSFKKVLTKRKQAYFFQFWNCVNPVSKNFFWKTLLKCCWCHILDYLYLINCSSCRSHSFLKNVIFKKLEEKSFKIIIICKSSNQIFNFSYLFSYPILVYTISS